MTLLQIIIVAIVLLVVGVLLWRNSPKFRGKAGKYVDKDGDGKPFG